MMVRHSALCPGTRVCCPTCGGVVFGTSFRNGDALLRCEHKVNRGKERANCGQHFYVYCTSRLCTVLAVTAEERKAFEADQSRPEEILAALGANLAEAA